MTTYVSQEHTSIHVKNLLELLFSPHLSTGSQNEHLVSHERQVKRGHYDHRRPKIEY